MHVQRFTHLIMETTEAEAFVYSIPASETTVGPVGLPRADCKCRLGDMFSAMGLTGGEDYSQVMLSL